MQLKSLKLKAYAKINLTLDVLGKRPDGFHEVATVIQGILLHDIIKLTRGNEGTIKLTCSESELGEPQDNLAHKAARLLAKDFPQAGNIRIHLEKKIPIAAGLGGGSSDAAAVLLGLNKLFDLKLPFKTLADYAGQLGSDVPFCLHPLTALAQGRGEIITPWREGPVLWLVLFKPPFSVSTKKVYANLHKVKIESRPSWENMAEALRNNQDAVIKTMGNALEYSTFALYPELRTFALEIAGLGFKRIMMAGSGPTLLGFANSEKEAQMLASSWGKRGWDIIVTRTLTGGDLTEEWS
jgi:4-diphosphocytidyl-2-C-methyl-D-erythritol kinase